jgi:hypothetical protein
MALLLCIDKITCWGYNSWRFDKDSGVFAKYGTLAAAANLSCLVHTTPHAKPVPFAEDVMIFLFNAASTTIWPEGFLKIAALAALPVAIVRFHNDKKMTH